jgi:hypothetical protein
VLLDGYNEGFKTFIFEKDDKLFRTKHEDIRIGQVVKEHEVFRTDEDYYDMLEYKSIVRFEEVYGNLFSWYTRYIFEYSTKERIKNKFPELFI